MEPLEQVPEYQRSRYLIKRLLSKYIWHYRGKFFGAFLCMILVAAATAANAWLMQPVLDDIFLSQNASMLTIVPLAVLVIALVKGAASYGQSILMRFIGQRIVTDMQAQLFNHLLYMDLNTLTKEASGRILSRFSNDITLLRRSVSSVMTGVAKEVLTLAFLIGVMLYQSATLSILAFTVFPLAIFPIVRLGKRMRKVSRRTLEELGQFTEKLDGILRGIRVIRAYQAEPFEEQRTYQRLESIFGLYIKAARTESLVSPIMEALAGIAIAAVIWYGGSQVISGETSPGAFFSFITAFIMAYKPVKSLSGLSTALQEGLASARRLFELLDQKPQITNCENAKQLAVKKGHITFEDVSFNYEPKKPALHHISLDVPGGKTVALVGASGGGKSTILNLILRFYEPQSGTIKIDNQSLLDVTMESLRSHIAFVSQEITLFDDTIAANIAYGNRHASREELIRAAKMAEAHEFIEDLPEKYDTIVGQDGLTLSGGQRQRIAIARALLKDAPILLLDEATSALDPISEKKIQAALKNLMKSRTTLVIAHRLSTVEEADLIYVLKRGKLVEQGIHTDLIKKKGGYYAKLAQGLDE